MIGITAVVVCEVCSAWWNSENILFIVRCPFNEPGRIILSSVARPEVDKRSESYEFITSFPIRAIKFSCDRAVFRLPEEEHDPDFGVSLLTAPEMFALLSTMVEPDFMPRIPTFVKEGHGIIPCQTRAPGTVTVKLQASADYKVACMLREGVSIYLNSVISR